MQIFADSNDFFDFHLFTQNYRYANIGFPSKRIH